MQRRHEEIERLAREARREEVLGRLRAVVEKVMVERIERRKESFEKLRLVVEKVMEALAERRP